ncbi:unnamed protein product [Amoebophrya sp. A120]|nr:unnamed protein product [Amoebophrya sp. A120]|eukprot:GSA120T00005983001.1
MLDDETRLGVVKHQMDRRIDRSTRARLQIFLHLRPASFKKNAAARLPRRPRTIVFTETDSFHFINNTNPIRLTKPSALL